jgi:hypothetical protein
VKPVASATQERALLASVDVRALDSLRWGPIRQMFPSFVEDIELGRYLRRLLENASCTAIQIEPHRDSLGHASTHVFDVFGVGDPV